MSVNVENINKVIQQLRNEKAFFDMSYWSIGPDIDLDIDLDINNVEYPENICGTPSCIGGWAEAILRYENKVDDHDWLSSTKIGEWLGIEDYQIAPLFFPGGEVAYVWGVYEATKEDAIAVLENLIETGEVDWIKILKEKKNG